MKRKRVFLCIAFTCILCIIIGTLVGCSTQEKIPLPEVKSNVFIYDDDNILDDNMEEDLNNFLVELEEKTEVEFAIISIKSLLNRNIETYSNNLFNTLGIGKKSKDNGILLVFSRSDNKVRLEIGRGLEGCLNDAKCGRILDDYFVPYRENDDYNTATELTAKAILKELCDEYNITISGLDLEKIQVEEADNESEESTTVDLLSIILVIIFLIILEFVTGYLFGNGFGDGIVIAILSSFGSSDGNSSGGGFGGGFSGGGGASR